MLKLLAITSLTLGLAACGGDGYGGGGGPADHLPEGPAGQGEGHGVLLRPREHHRRGRRRADDDRAQNDGSLAHDLRIEKDSEDIGGTPIFTGGETKSAKVTLAPGDYEFLCTVGDHADRGMKGKLTVR